MGTRRTIVVVAGVVIGVVAALAVWSYLGSVQERAYDDARLVEVFVVQQDIRRGLPGDEAISEGRVQADEIPQKFRPSTAITSLDAIRGKVAVSNLATGQILVDGAFGEATVESSAFAQRIPTGQVAISIRVDDVHGVASLIAPGDKVNILVPTDDGIRMLFQNVNVIAVGKSLAAEPGEAQADVSGDAGLITFSVPPQAAERIALASQTASLYLTLVPPGNQVVPVAPVSGANLFQGPPSPYG